MLVKTNKEDNNDNTPLINEENELNDSKKDILIMNENQTPNSKQEDQEQKKEENKKEDEK